MSYRRTALVCLGLAALAVPAHAQKSTTLMGDLLNTVTAVETKMMGLAKAMPASAYEWRAGAARTTSQVIMHVAADNYLIPAAMGMAAPAETGIDGKDYKTAQAFENRKVTRDQAIAELGKSFAHLKAMMGHISDGSLTSNITMFGSSMTARAGWIVATTHLHEHLGQLIAYARANNVVPPWSQ